MCLEADLAAKIQVAHPLCLWKSQAIKKLPIIKAIYQLIFSIPLFLTPFQPPIRRKYCQIVLKKKISSRCLCGLIGWALSCTSESWLLSNNLISQMEKQHLFSCSSTYGSHCCCAEPKQVAPASTALRSPVAPRDGPAPLGCEGHRLPRQSEARTSSAYAKHPSQSQLVGENAQTCI